jgi:hypothetical protein
MYTPYNIFDYNLPKYNPGGQSNNPDKPDPGTYKIGDIIDISGEKKVVTGWDPVAGKYTTETWNPLKGDIGDYTKDYETLEKALNDPDVKKALWEEYKKDKTNYKITSTGSKYIRGIKDADDLVKKYLQAEKAIMAINANYSADEIKKLNLDNNSANRKKLFEEVGINFNPGDIAIFQKAYYDLADIYNSTSTPDAIKQKLGDFDWEAKGDIDTDSPEYKTSGKTGVTKGYVSQVDDAFGDNTVFQFNRLKQPTITQSTITQKPQQTTTPITPGKMAPPVPRAKPEFWTQDKNLVTNALIDYFRTKKINPWAPPIKLETPRTAFLDYTAPLQEANAQMLMGIQGANAFGSPQGYVSTATKLAGDYGPMAQGIISNTHNQNIQLANTNQAQIAAVRNQENLANAERLTNLYDKNAIAEQQYLNTEIARRKNIVDATNNAWTNRGLTQSQNIMSYPFQVDPVTGYTYYDPRLATNMEPSETDFETRQKRLDDLLTSNKYQNQDIETIYKILYPDENIGNPYYRSSQRGRQRYQQNNYDPRYDQYFMYPGASGANPYGYPFG